MSRTVALLGAFDTKGPDYAFVKAMIEAAGLNTLLIDTSVIGQSALEADITSKEVAAAGGRTIGDLRAERDRGNAIAVMAEGAGAVVKNLHSQDAIDGIIALGGGAGTLVGTAGMRVLPLGIPKVMVSTVASADVNPYVGTSDICMMHSVVDVAGVNRISRHVYTNAAAAIIAMVKADVPEVRDKPAVALTMFGNTTRAAEQIQSRLEQTGFEVITFHATGTGGKTMENLISDGFFTAVIDLTTTELVDEICGGVMSAGPGRLEAAGAAGLPQVVIPGCADMCNFWARPTVPEKYKDRILYEWNPNVTLMRTNDEENSKLAAVFAEKLNAAVGPVAFLIPVKGFSELDTERGPFFAPDTIRLFSDTLRQYLKPGIPVHEVATDINSSEFTRQAVETLLEMLPPLEDPRATYGS